jgi:diguanylate cyclase (GGDEF)-like protein
MARLRSKWHGEAAVAAIIAAITLSAGVRLIILSTQRHASEAHEAAQNVAMRLVRAIDARLQALADRAESQTRGLRTARERGGKPHSAMIQPGSGSFWLTEDGQPVMPAGADEPTATDIVRELATADRSAPAASAVLGPMRLGSHWIVVARAAVTGAAGTFADRAVRWSIAYCDLEQLLSGAKWGEITRAGYDLELTEELEHGATRAQILYAARATPLGDAVVSNVHFPPAFPHRSPAATWSIAVRPRTGWHPLSELVSDGVILGISVWLLTAIAYDTTRSSRRARAALAAARHRLLGSNLRLMKEVAKCEDLQRSFEHARYHDAFTGLPNRRYLIDQLDRGLARARSRRGYRLGLILVGIDRLKLIHDTMGVMAGEELMVQVAQRFQKLVSPVDRVISRWSGDEFAVLLYDLHSIDTAMTVAKMLEDTFGAPFELRRQLVKIAARFGVTCVESGLQRAEEVMREADIALSAANPDQGTTIVAYSPEMRERTLSVAHLEADLQGALERREFKLLYQPIVDLRSDRIVGCEALLRWLHPTEGLLTPDRFLAIAEEGRLIVPITHWIIRRACRTAGSLSQYVTSGESFYVGVNLPAQALADPELADVVGHTLAAKDVPAALLRFEITEGNLISNVGAARELLDRFHVMGIKLLLDNFGTGYSSLNYLQLFPFDYLKIDQSFVRHLSPDGKKNELLRAIVQMAASVGLQAVAEGIETPEIAHVLKELGCHFGQGDLFSKPVDATVIAQRLRVQQSEAAAALPADTASVG